MPDQVDEAGQALRTAAGGAVSLTRHQALLNLVNWEHDVVGLSVQLFVNKENHSLMERLEAIRHIEIQKTLNSESPIVQRTS